MIRTTYACDACELEWTVSHDSSDDALPPCPVCEAKSKWSPKPLRIKTNKSRAMDLAQKTAEAMGHSNMKSSTREGESVAMGPREPTTSENEALMSQGVQAMREVANRSAGTVSPQMTQFLAATGGTLTDPTSPQVMPSLAPGNVVPLLQTQAYNDAKAATKAVISDPKGVGMSPMGILHKARKHERFTLDPRIPVSGATIMSKYKP